MRRARLSLVAEGIAPADLAEASVGGSVFFFFFFFFYKKVRWWWEGPMHGNDKHNQM